MDARPVLNFSSRLCLRDFESEMWRLYFGVVKGLLTAITSLIYLFVLIAFFAVQHTMLAAGKIAVAVSEWCPEKPRVFGLRAASGE